MVIQFLKAYLKIVGGDFLKVCLAGLVKTLCVGERKTSFEIDPSRAPPDEIEANMRAFVDKMQQFMDYMTSKQVLDAMPPGIRYLSIAICSNTNVEFYHRLYPKNRNNTDQLIRIFTSEAFSCSGNPFSPLSHLPAQDS